MDEGDGGRAAPGARADWDNAVYEELRRLASQARRREVRPCVDTTALIHEAWLKLRNNPGLEAMTAAHFRAVAARAMRQLLVDEARRRNAAKRGGEAVPVTFDENAVGVSGDDERLLSLQFAIEELERLSPRHVRVVEGRFFGGETTAETAEALGVSESAVERDWRAARAWLSARMRTAR